MERNERMILGRLAVVVSALGFLASGSAYAQDEQETETSMGNPFPVWYVPQSTVQNGDLDGSGQINITDVIRLAGWLFQGGEEPVVAACEVFGAPASTHAPSPKNGDINGTDEINITDLILLVQYLYMGGKEPVVTTCAPVYPFSK